jgi:hypothetical protein
LADAIADFSAIRGGKVSSFNHSRPTKAAGWFVGLERSQNFQPFPARKKIRVMPVG